MSWKKLLPAHTYPHHATYCLLSPPPPLLLLCPIFVYMHQKKITFSAAKIHGNIFLSRILTSNIYALSLNPHKKKLRETVKLHLEKKSSKKKSAWWKRTLLSADVWKKKKVLNVKFFLTCSRATSSEEQICLKTKILIEVYGKKKKTTMKETKQTTFICYYCWLTLTKSIFSWNQFFTKISILYLERNREQQTNTNIHEVTSWRLVWTKNDDDLEDLIDVKDHAKKEDKCSKLAVYDSIWKFIQKKPNFSHYSTRISGIILNFLNSTAIATLLLLLLQLT